MFRDGQRSPGSHQVVTGIMRETAGLAQSTGRTHTDERQRRGTGKGVRYRVKRRRKLERNGEKKERR